jgi:hypothetical protein
MARVAVCPQCSHEILILDDANQDAWAKCPECRAFFQISQAAAREIQPAIPIEDESADRSGETAIVDDTMLAKFTDEVELTFSGASDATVSEYTAELADSQDDVTEVEKRNDTRDELTTEFMAPNAETRISNDPAATASGSADLTASGREMPVDEIASDIGTKTAEEPTIAKPEERIEEATDRIDKWFRETKSHVETPIAAAGDNRESADVDDVPIEQPLELPEDQPAWDESQHMERLLADAESANANNGSNENQFADEGDAAHSDDEPAEIGPQGQQAADKPEFFIPPGRIPRRQKSLLRTLATTAASGIVGLALGYYALLWMLGPTGDFLHVAHNLPSAVLPAEFQSESALRPVERGPAEPTNDTFASASEETDAPDTAEQTSYTAAADDRYGTTIEPSSTGDQPPLPFEAATAAPLSRGDETGVGRIANAPSYSADELAVALQAAQEEQPKLVAGSLDDGPDIRRAKGFGYLKLCDLAQKLAFVDTTTRADYASALVTDAERLLQQTLADEHTRGEVARIVPVWIDSPHRKHGGVFFAGSPRQSAEKGTVVEYQFDLDANASVIVLLPPAGAEQLADSSKPIGIVGWIVDSPAKLVNGYTGDAPQAIWASRVLPLE